MAVTDYEDLPWDQRVDVEVHADGGWHPGEISARRRRGSRWEGFVRYTVVADGFRASKIDWFDYDDLRPTEADET